MQNLNTFWGVWVWPLTIVGAWLSAFLGSYLTKRGENLATHEDLENLCH